MSALESLTDAIGVFGNSDYGLTLRAALGIGVEPRDTLDERRADLAEVIGVTAETIKKRLEPEAFNELAHLLSGIPQRNPIFTGERLRKLLDENPVLTHIQYDWYNVNIFLNKHLVAHFAIWARVRLMEDPKVIEGMRTIILHNFMPEQCSGMSLIASTLEPLSVRPPREEDPPTSPHGWVFSLDPSANLQAGSTFTVGWAVQLKDPEPPGPSPAFLCSPLWPTVSMGIRLQNLGVRSIPNAWSFIRRPGVFTGTHVAQGRNDGFFGLIMTHRKLLFLDDVIVQWSFA